MDGTDADREENGGPGTERDRRPVQDRSARSRVGAAAPEEVAAERREPERPHEAERQRDGRRRERDEVTRAPVAPLSPERARRAVHQRAAEPEDEHPVQPAADERPDRDHEAVTQRVVEQRTRRRRHEHACDAREPEQREHGLLPRVRRLIGVVAERREDGTRRL